MEDTFNSGNELWTEIALSGGLVEDLAGADCLSAGEQSRLSAVKTFAVANSYIRAHHKLTILKGLEDVLNRKTGTTD